MKCKMNERISFSFEGIITEGTIIAVADEKYSVYDEIEQITYENIEKDWILAKEDKVTFVGLSRVKGRLFGTFMVGNKHYHKILSSTLEPYFVDGIPDDQAICLKAWATGTIITPVMMQEYIHLDQPDGPIIHHPQYAAMLISLLKHDNDDQALVQLDSKTVELLTSSCQQVELLPRDFLLYWMEMMIDEQYFRKREGQDDVPDRMIESVVTFE